MQYLLTVQTCGKTLEEIEVLFGKDGPYAWQTKKGHSRLDAEIDAVAGATVAKGEARASIEKVIADEKAAISRGTKADETV